MGMYDTVLGTPEGYDNTIKAWKCSFAVYGPEDSVPSVEGMSTYSIRLYSHTEAPPRYIWVVNNTITAVGAEAPLPEAPAFSKWGGHENEENPMLVAVRQITAAQEQKHAMEQEKTLRLKIQDELHKLIEKIDSGAREYDVRSVYYEGIPVDALRKLANLKPEDL